MDKRKALISSIIGLACMFVLSIVFAATNTTVSTALGLSSDKNYAIDVIDDGSGTSTNDENVELTTKIIDSSNTELTLETYAKNINEVKARQVAIVLDTSYSMETNAEEYDIKTMAKNLATKIFADVPNVKISVSDCSGVKTALTTNQSSVSTAITNVSGGYNIADALNYAKSTLTPSDTTETYVIVFTDATDNVDLSIFSNEEMEESQKIKVYSILPGITSTAFGNVDSPKPEDGKVYMMDEFINQNKSQEIVNDIDKVIINPSMTANFNEEILKSSTKGNFKLEIIEDETNGTAVQNSDGSISWNVDGILKAQGTWKVKYKLILNTSATIGTDSFYNDIKIFKEMKLKYTSYDTTEEKQINVIDANPTIQICDAYSLTINAVGKDSTMPVEGAKFDVIGINEKGETVIEETALVADKNGSLTIKTIKELGKINYTITPNLDGLIGYEKTDAVNVIVNNEYTATGGMLTVSYFDSNKVSTDDSNGKREVIVEVPIELQKFKFVVDVSDLSDPDIKLPEVDFRLIQPKLNNKYEMEALYGTTNSNGQIEFEASIMSVAGTYEYILSQMSDKDGYENVGNTTIRVTFDSQGKVVDNGVETLYNANIEGSKDSDSVVLLKVKEKCNSSNTFNMKINLTDEETNEAIEGAIYDITVTKINSSSTGNDTMKYTKVTSEDGSINLKAIASESGYTKIVLHENTSNNAYITETKDKEIIINRQNGIIYEITMGGDYTKKDPDHNNGIVVNLTNKKKSEINVVRMHLTQKDDTDMNLINVPMELKDVTPKGEGGVYNAVTNGDGYAEFILKDPSKITDGTYYFEVNTNPTPMGYYDPDVKPTIKVSIIDGKIADIVDVTETGNYMPIVNSTVLNENKDTTISYVAYADYALTANANSTSYLKINLTDADNGTPINNGKYEIRMDRDGAQIANAGSTGKYTGTDGFTKKMSIPGLDATPVTITISQVYDETRQTGYKVDQNIYSITVHKESDGSIVVDSATLENGSELPLGISTTFEDSNKDNIMDTVVFNHINTIINPGDVILDFSIVKYDYITKQPDQSQDLMLWSDDFLFYDPQTKQYTDFKKDNPYNPFKTGVNSSSSSAGQVDVKLKPAEDALPEVEDVNRDAYPTGGAVLHIGEFNPSTGEVIEGTEYQIQINFTYSKETGTYKYSGYSNLSNWALLKAFHHSTSQNSSEGYLETAILEIWSNYGETANFAIDFSKYNYLGEALPGAQYQVKIALPTGKYINLTQDVINGNDTIEIPNAYIKEGAIITIVETTAPIGYEIDTQEASFKVDSIDSATGMINISQYGVENSRITLDGHTIKNQNGEFKFVQKIKLVDLEKNNTKFGITTKNRTTLECTQGNSYKIITNTGSSAISPLTNEDGNSTTLIGGEKKRDYMEYTISQNLSDSTQVTRFYKRLASDIHVKVYFDDNGNIDNDPSSANYYGTLCSSVDSNYGTTWYIDSVNGDNRINVVILQDKEDPLNINFKTVDSFTSATLTNIAEYEVTPTEELSGKGETSAQVGYVDPNKAVTYTVKASVKENYVGIPDQQFTVEYDADGNISKVTAAPNSEHLAVKKNTSNSKTVDLTITIEPAVPFAIHTTDYYTGANLQNAEFDIVREDEVISVAKSTNSEGKATVFNGEFGEGSVSENKTYIYTVRQKSATYTYATVEEFRIAVEYNSNREIVNAYVYTETESTNKFVTVSKTQPSTSSNYGYNGNNKGIVNIEIKNYPAFNIEFTNVDRINNSIKLSGTKFDVKSSIVKYPITDTSDSKEQITASTLGTDVNGVEVGYVDRTPLGGVTATYEITNSAAADGYQKIRSTIKLEVDFDTNGYVNVSNGNPVRVIEGAEYVDVSLYNPANTDAENFGIKLIVKSSPIFRINLDNIDRKDYNNGITTNLAGAEYTITSDYDTQADVVKTTENTVVAMLAETPLNNYVTYTIKEVKQAIGYQTIEKDIIMKVHFNIDGCVDNIEFTDTKNNSYANATRVTPIVETKDNFTVNLSIRNNPLIALDLNKTSEDGKGLNNVLFNIKGKIKNTDEIIYEENVTTISGLGDFGINRALDNTTVVYTISETKNTVGYQYIPSDLTLEITYDNEGRIAKDSASNYKVQLTPQVTWATITEVTDYGIKLNVINDRIEEIGINLNTIDKYDDAKRAEQAEIKAYFTKDNVSYNEDENHSTVLVTGRDSDGDRTPDFAHGQDYQTLGKAENIVKEEIEGIKTATLVLKEIKTPNTYYDVNNNVSKDNIYMSWNYYGVSSARINLTFTDEGKITSATLIPDSLGTTALGKCLDSKYIKVSIDETNPYMLNIDLRYYPMLEMTINAVSDDTYSRATDNNDNELIGTYTIKSQHYNDQISTHNSYNTNLRNGLVTAGYIGNSNYGGIVPGAKTKDSKVLDTGTNTYKENNYALWVGEQYDVNNSADVASNGRIRYVYVYEPGGEVSEPANNYSGYEQLQYQQHGQQDYSPMYTSYNNALIGAIQVTYDVKGEISDVKILEDRGANSDNRTEQADNSKYITAEVSDNKHGIIVKVQYKRTTTIEAKVTDNVTGAELTNITLTPCLGGTVNTNRFYKYTNSEKIRNLAKGENTWTYWGGNDSNGERRYVIGTRFNNSTMYNGYDTIGNIQLDIHYDEYGYVDINSSRVLSTNANGEPNAVIEKVDKDKIYLNIIASRKFDIQIDKKDVFDTSKTLTDARFSITSSKTDIRNSEGSLVNTKSNINQGTRTQIGLMHKSETVTYTISETFTPEGYIPLDNFDMEVVFDENGVISKIILDDGTVLYDVFGIHKSKNIPIKLISVAEKFNGLKPQNITDLRFELYNTPKLETNITLKDQFYTDEPIEGVTYSITNNTYNISATGNTTTDENGNISTYVGTVYPKETVRYTIKQEITPNGYYTKNSDIIIDVTFDDNGYISNYVVVKGNDEQVQISLNTAKRGFNLIIYNKPKDVKIGIEKYDELTKEKLEGVGFKISRQEVNSSSVTEWNGETQVNGNITETVDKFDNDKEVVYTITETKQLDAYRRIGDIVIRVKYDADGRVSYYNVDSNPSNVQIDFANKRFETLANGDKVHIKLTIPNDDTYDVIVRNEDKNIDNLGIEGTVYDISINGIEQVDPLVPDPLRTTNSSGYMSLINRKENGNISIKVSEETIGTGYRENVQNSADLDFIKGVQTYSLDLDTSTLASKGYTLISGPDAVYDTNYLNGKAYTIRLNNIDNTQVIVEIYEDTGKIVERFKNESKLMLNITKIDAENSEKRLEGAEFEIKAQEVDSFGNPQGDATTITSSIITNEDGMAYLDLGVRPQSKNIKYTFKEITPPSGYIAIENVSVTCKYDASGRIASKESDSKRIGADNSWYNLNTTIKNGDMETYSVKVISVDSRKGSTATGSSTNRINGSTFNITVKDSNGTTIAETINRQTAKMPDSFGYSEEGIIVLSGLKAEGTISVDISQTGLVDGFVRGDNQTTGTLTFENTFVKETDESKPEVELSNLNINGFVDSYINTNENQIVIKVYNDPQVKLNLHKSDIDTKSAIEGATFTITSEIDGQNKVATVPTTLNVASEGTDAEGNEEIVIGAPEYGKTVIYTIHENKITDYEQLDDIKLKITYDTNGKINDWEVLSDETYIDIKTKLLRNNGKYDWKDYTEEEMESFTEDEFTKIIKTKDSRQINASIKNKASEKVIPYTIIIEPQDEMRNPVEGISLKLNLTQGKGTNPVFPVKTTDANGQVSYTANGSDRLEIGIDIIDTKSYTFNQSLTCIVYKNSATGHMEPLENNNIYPEIDNENHIIKLVILGTISDDKYSISLMKMDKGANTTITNNPATFTMTMKEDIEVEIPEDGTIADEDSSEDIVGGDYIDSDENEAPNYIETTVISDRQTNDKGILSLPNLDMPSEVGTYTYRIYETESPEGYKQIKEPMEIEITFGYNELGNKVITNIVSKDTNNLFIAKKTEKGFVMCVNNREEVENDQYMLNIFKVDSETGEKLNGAIVKVKLADANGTWVYTESGENTDKDGQLDYCYIEQDKDYEVRLKHMTRPTVNEIKARGSDVLVHEYTFQEVAAPDGYALDKTEVTLTIEFEIGTDAEGNEIVQIRDAKSSNVELLRITDTQQDQISADILNREETNSYTVHYDSNTTDNVMYMPADQIKIAGSPLTIDANIPEREGYTFVEWNTQEDGSGTSFPAGGTYAIDADVTLFAKWKTTEYTVHYESNAPIDDNTGVAVGLVTDMPEDQIKTHNVDLTLNNNIPKIPNLATYYEFESWNTEKDGSGTSYKANELYSINSDITLYAQWNYTISYQANIPIDTMGFPMGNANNIPNNQTEKVNDLNPAVISINVPTMDGYKFKEWNTKKDGTGESYNPNDIYTNKKGLELYAIWQYEIIYDENIPIDSSGFVADITVNDMPVNPQLETASSITGKVSAIIANTTDNPNVPNTTPDNYAFKEWNTKADGTGDSYNPDDTYNGNIGITLYAIWEQKDVLKDLYLKSDNYTISDVTFETNSKYSINTENSNEYNEGDKYILGIMPYIKNPTGNIDENNEGTTISKFKEKIVTNAEKITILQSDGKTEITDETTLVATGQILELTKGNQSINLKLIVRGDCWSKSVNKKTGAEGQLSASDFTQLKAYVADKTDDKINSPIQDECLRLSLDVNLDGKINARDVTFIGKAITNYNNQYLINNIIN